MLARLYAEQMIIQDHILKLLRQLSAYNELFDKYQRLLTEVSNLKEENRALKAKLAITDVPPSSVETSSDESEAKTIMQQPVETALHPGICSRSDTREKVRLFMSLFRGREDVYPTHPRTSN